VIQTIEIATRPGFRDAVGEDVRAELREAGLEEARSVRFVQVYHLDTDADADALERAARELLADPVAQVHAVGGPVLEAAPGTHVLAVRKKPGVMDPVERSARRGLSELGIETRALRDADDPGALPGSAATRRDVELETIAQTWSEHCKHKTLTGRIRFERARDRQPAPTTDRRRTRALDRDFCLSVFVDNAGVIAFDDDDCVCIKVETHNHPPRSSPTAAPATGIGGVIRDILGTGPRRAPDRNTDVFCVAPPDLAARRGAAGCLHPRRVLRGVVAGVRDYGNRMGIPTVNGAVYFDERYVGNPLVYCGCVGMMPRDAVAKQREPGDRDRRSSAGAPGATASTARRSPRSN
jgi:phosphoribosylformylglycinamidine (FGAM) synthase PurS component